MGGELHSFPGQRPDRETHLRKLHGRFAVVSRRLERRRERAWYLRNWKLIAVALAFASICGWSIAETEARSILDGVRHILAAPNCSMARLVSVAPARYGQPGYWRSHDADDDGIACEPWLRRRTANSYCHRLARLAVASKLMTDCSLERTRSNLNPDPEDGLPRANRDVRPHAATDKLQGR